MGVLYCILAVGDGSSVSEGTLVYHECSEGMDDAGSNIKADRDVEVDRTDIRIGDVIQVEGTDKRPGNRSAGCRSLRFHAQIRKKKAACAFPFYR